MMDDYPEFKPHKRIKLEHSYARETDQVGLATIKVEDPLKISPEDLENIKKEIEEPETVEIKKEPGVEYQHVCDGEKCENVHDEKSLMDMVSSEPCESAESNYFFANLGLVNCDGEAANGSNANPDFVPKVVFQQMQKMYEKAMADVKSLTKKLSTEKQRKTSQSARNANNTKTLKNDIKRLKEQLTSSKVSEDSLNRTLGSRAQSELELKNTIMTLRKQIDKLMTQNKACNTHVTFLKQTVSNKEITIKTLTHTLEQRSKILNLKRKEENAVAKLTQMYDSKETQYKDLVKKCAHLSQNLMKTNSKLILQRSELEKLKLDMDIMDRSIIDSVKTRQALRDQVAVIEKEFQEVKESPSLSLKLQEAQKSLNKSNSRLELTQKQLDLERKNAMILIKEKKQLVNEHNRRYRELEAQGNLLKSTVATLKKSYKQKAEQYHMVVAERGRYLEEVERCKSEINTVQTNMQKKVDEAVAKQCQYCGF